MKNSVTGGVGQAGSPSTQVNENPSIDENSSANRTDQNKAAIKPREKYGTDLEWEMVPTDIIFRIFDVLTQQVFQSQGAARVDALRAILHFGSVSISQRHSFQEFLKNHPNGVVLRPEIFAFTSKVVPLLIENVLRKNNLVKDEINLFVFHQANKFMLEFLRNKIDIDELTSDSLSFDIKKLLVIFH